MSDAGESFDNQLAMAYSVIAQLIEDRDWIRSIADDRSERIQALELQLRAAQMQLEVLRASGNRSGKRLRSSITAFLAGLAAVSQVSGITLRDIVERPSDPLTPIVYLLKPSDMAALSLVDSGVANTSETQIASAAGSASNSGVRIGDPAADADPPAANPGWESPDTEMTMAGPGNSDLGYEDLPFLFSLEPDSWATAMGGELSIANDTDRNLVVMINEPRYIKWRGITPASVQHFSSADLPLTLKLDPQGVYTIIIDSDAEPLVFVNHFGVPLTVEVFELDLSGRGPQSPKPNP